MNKYNPFASEDILVDHLKKNDKAAFEYLYDNYAGGLYGIVCKILKDDEKANDVMQEAFMKIWRNIGAYEKQKGSLFTWMLNVTRNTAIDVLRADAKHSLLKRLDIVQESELSPTNIYHPSIATIDLRSFVEKLIPDRRLLIELVYFQGYTQEEASEFVQLPLGTVKSRLRSALQQMKHQFEAPAAVVVSISH